MVLATVPLWLNHTHTQPQSQHGDKNTGDNAKGGGPKKCPIYSVDVHPDRTRFVTAGGDGKARIWSMNALSFNLESERHSGTLNNIGYESSASSSSSDSNTCSNDNGNKSTSHPQPSEQRKADDVDDETATTTPDINRLLSTLSSHEGSVLCTRFSHNGKYLASAGDDAHVCIYEHKPVSAASMYGTNLLNLDGNGDNNADNNKSKAVENWQRIKILRGHNLDVVGLAFAPTDTFLASCSLDRDTPIVIWNIDATSLASTNSMVLRPHKVIGKDVHQSAVKGIAWDPVYSYLVSSGDDPAICVWNTEDWSLVKKLGVESGIFGAVGTSEAENEKNSGQSFYDLHPELTAQLSLFRRVSFAPDGSHLCCTNANMSGKPIAAMISRNGWCVSGDGAANLVGHKQAIVSSRHCSAFFSFGNAGSNENGNNNGKASNLKYGTLVACGDKRGFLSVWSTRKSRPIFKLQCSEQRNTITDIAWSNNGEFLMVTNLDGTVVCLQFSADEIGDKLSDEDCKKIFQKKYGIEDIHNVANSQKSKLVENNLLADLEITENSGSAVAKEVKINGTSHINTPKVTRKGGKKRIRPQLITLSTEKPTKINKPNSEQSSENGQGPIGPIQNALHVAKTISNRLADENPASKETQQLPQSRQTGIEQIHQDISTATARRVPNSETLSLFTLLQDNISIDLPAIRAEEAARTIADITNKSDNCEVLVSQNGLILWRDILISTTITAAASSANYFVAGATDGSVYVYGTSSTTGFASGKLLRSMPPLIFTSSIQSIAISDKTGWEMVVITTDFEFNIVDLKNCTNVMKGSLFPAVQNMLSAPALSKDVNTNNIKLLSAQLTKAGLLILLKIETIRKGIQSAFLYNDRLQLWQRISDNRFQFSDFYSNISSASNNNFDKAQNPNLSHLDRCTSSSMAHRQPVSPGDITRCHCEDRMACALALKSYDEFRYWLRMYTRRIVSSSIDSAEALRFFVDVIMGKDDPMSTSWHKKPALSFWSHVYDNNHAILSDLSPKMLLGNVILPEVARIPALQRLANEIRVEVDAMIK